MNEPVEQKREGAPEWMVSFADMITIMMSFFVVMFAIASGEAEKSKQHRNPQQQAAIESLNARFGPKYQPFANWGLMDGDSPLRTGSRIKTNLPEKPPEDPQAAVKKPNKGTNRIRVPGHGERTVVGGIVSFGGDGLLLAEKDRQRLKKIAEELAGKPQEIEVVGHVSPMPLPPESPYRDRWELAYARCRRIVDALERLKIDSERIRIGVLHSGKAAADNAAGTQDGQVDIYLDDSLAEKYVPGEEAGK
jgi:chemotaxis protein MotB